MIYNGIRPSALRVRFEDWRDGKHFTRRNSRVQRADMKGGARGRGVGLACPGALTSAAVILRFGDTRVSAWLPLKRQESTCVMIIYRAIFWEGDFLIFYED